MPDQNKNTTAKPNHDKAIFWAAIIFFLFSLTIISVHFIGTSFSDCVNELKSDCTASEWADYRSAWGQFGDFMGGMVNPFLGLLTVYLLVTELRESRAAQEKTEQALRDQIALSKSQNNFANYFKHLEEFSIFIQSFNKSRNKSIFATIDSRTMHKIIFSECIDGQYSPSKDLSKKFISCRNLVFQEFVKLDGIKVSQVVNVVKRIDEIILCFSRETENCVDLPAIGEIHVKLKDGSSVYQISSTNIYFHMALRLELLNYFENALKFDIQNPIDIDQPDNDICQLMLSHLLAAFENNWGMVYELEISDWHPIGKALRK